MSHAWRLRLYPLVSLTLWLALALFAAALCRVVGG